MAAVTNRVVPASGRQLPASARLQAVARRSAALRGPPHPFTDVALPDTYRSYRFEKGCRFFVRLARAGLRVAYCWVALHGRAGASGHTTLRGVSVERAGARLCSLTLRGGCPYA